MPNPVQNIAAKTAGKAAGLRARAQGLVGVFKVLAEQHAQATSLLERALHAAQLAQRRELWTALRRELICHERAELGTVYPVIEEHPLCADIARQHADGARELEAAISAIDALAYESPRWRDSLQSLFNLVQQHVEQEEREFFPRAQDAIGKEAAHALERPFLAAVAQCKQQLGA